MNNDMENVLDSLIKLLIDKNIPEDLIADRNISEDLIANRNILEDASPGLINLADHKMLEDHKVLEENKMLEEYEKLHELLLTVRNAIISMGKGDLNADIKGKGYVIGSLKNLQASLKHLTWQTKAIASGDFSQKVDFLGEFSEAFNSMAQKLEATLNEVKELKDHFELIFNTSPDPTMITSIDSGKIINFNEAFLEVTGYKEEEIQKGLTVTEDLYENPMDRLPIIAELKEKKYCNSIEVNFLRKNREIMIGLVSAKTIQLNGIPHIISVIRDITEIKKIEIKLRESEERHRLLADNANDVIWTMDLNGKITYVSPSVEHMRGYTVEEVMNQTPEEQLSLGSLKYFAEGLVEATQIVKSGNQLPSFRGEIEQPCKDGSTVWTDVTVSGIYNEEGKFIALLGVSRDITERRKMEMEIKKLSITDKLTQIYNRMKLDEVLESEIERAKRSGVAFALIILDIDHFKRINDTYGHQTGDAALMELSNLLRKNIRETDVVGRWGGEEFLIIATNTDGEGGFTLAEKLRELIEAEIFPGVGQLTCSFGVSAYGEKSTAASMVSRADEALYEAKRKGRNRVVVES